MEEAEQKKSLDRRTLLKYSAVAAAAVVQRSIAAPAPKEEAQGLGAEDASAPTTGADQGFARFVLREGDDSPLKKERQALLHARDMFNDPLPQTIRIAEGRVRVGLAKEPVQIVCRLDVPNFGEVYCYADNEGKGYTTPVNVEFVVEAAATRLRRVRETAEHAKAIGVASDPEFDRHLEAAGKPVPKKSGKERTAAAYESLSHGLHAGERIALNMARHRIARLGEPRKDFGFGALVSGYNNEGPGFVDKFKRAFNQATAAWYTWGKEEPPEARISYDRMEQSIVWCEQNGIKPKGFGYCYMSRGATVEWMRPIENPDGSREFNPRWSFDKIRDEYAKIVKATATRYHGRVKVMEIINEAHDKANLWHLNHRQILEITQAVCDAAREGSADVQRMINHCCQWGEYAKKPLDDGSRAWSPLRYLDDCVKHGVEFEVVGLQLYYPQYDVFEINRMLDRHTKWDKPIEITEIATASQPGLDPESMRPKTSAPGWHGPWSESTQADWLEAMYTLCYSKPLFQAVTWWDFSDHVGHFWPFGGMIRKDLSPKPSYERLLELQKRWGVAKA